MKKILIAISIFMLLICAGCVPPLYPIETGEYYAEGEKENKVFKKAKLEIYEITKEEYDDASQIIGTGGGVVKGSSGNKMNEIKPHTNWAKKTMNRARAFGVIENEGAYVKLFAVNE